MSTRTLAAAIAAALTIAAPAQAHQHDTRPTEIEAKNSAAIVYDNYAESLDGKLHLPRYCPPRGKRSRVCRVRITGKLPQRLRVVVTLSRSGESLTVTGRPEARS